MHFGNYIIDSYGIRKEEVISTKITDVKEQLKVVFSTLDSLNRNLDTINYRFSALEKYLDIVSNEMLNVHNGEVRYGPYTKRSTK